MKALAFNSSPNMDKGGTALILTPFLEGMKKAGAEVELFYVQKLNIEPCIADKWCWIKTPGRCSQKDDMDMLYPKLARCDVIVLGTPVYLDGMTGTMKVLIDRFIPLLQPFVEIRDGHCRHPLREDVKQGKKVVLISVCGLPEMDNFDPLVSHVDAICNNFGWEFAGALLRPYAVALPQLKQLGLPVDEVYEAARDAGQQLAQNGKMGSQASVTVGRGLVSQQEYIQHRNEQFKRELAALADE